MTGNMGSKEAYNKGLILPFMMNRENNHQFMYK